MTTVKIERGNKIANNVILLLSLSILLLIQTVRKYTNYNCFSFAFQVTDLEFIEVINGILNLVVKWIVCNPMRSILRLSTFV